MNTSTALLSHPVAAAVIDKKLRWFLRQKQGLGPFLSAIIHLSGSIVPGATYFQFFAPSVSAFIDRSYKRKNQPFLRVVVNGL